MIVFLYRSYIIVVFSRNQFIGTSFLWRYQIIIGIENLCRYSFFHGKSNLCRRNLIYRKCIGVLLSVFIRDADGKSILAILQFYPVAGFFLHSIYRNGITLFPIRRSLYLNDAINCIQRILCLCSRKIR